MKKKIIGLVLRYYGGTYETAEIFAVKILELFKETLEKAWKYEELSR